MNTFVDKLLGVDKEAQQILDSAQQYYDQIQKETEAEKAKLRARYEEKARRHIEAVRGDTQRQAATEIAEISGRYQALAKSLEDVYGANREQWVRELYSRIL